MFKKEFLKVYFICGTQDCINKDFLVVLEDALKSGITMFQFREKGQNSKKGQEKLELAEKAFNLCKKYNVPFIVNDDIEIAKVLDVDGIHIGQDDMLICEARKLFPNKIIGLSIRNMEDYKNSKIELADYIGVGPIFDTISKDDASKSCGLGLIKQLRNINSKIPIVAIGGITVSTTKDIILAGADGVSVISAISRAENTKQAVKEFIKQVNL